MEIKLPEDFYDVSIKPSSSKEIVFCIILQLLCGIQVSVFFTSMWQYIVSILPTFSMHFYGLLIAIFSVGQAISSPLFGALSNKLGSRNKIVAFSLLLMASGNLLYACLVNLKSDYVPVAAVGARLFVGVGNGILSVIRGFVATVGDQRKRSSNIAAGIGSFVLGVALGPTIPMIFSIFGSKGYKVMGMVINLFTAPAYFNVILFLIMTIILIFFVDLSDRHLNLNDTASLVSEADEETGSIKKEEVVSKIRLIPTISCIFLYVSIQCVSTNDEVIAAPYTIAMYNWNSTEAVRYNGILLTFCCILSLIFYALIAWGPLLEADKRKVILYGLVMFIIYHAANMPWPFYSGTLKYIPENATGFDEVGGCLRSYKWCKDAKRVPLGVYIVSVVIGFGLGYPLTSAPLGALYSDILGNCKQDFMHGVMEFFGSLARCFGPILSTYLFQTTGYKYAMGLQIIILSLSFLLFVIFFNRLVPTH
uniref:MFS domain-containing protein n=1 Tax=Strongyloides venezuelensis TaxID=75913 RepID=A0A0K0F4V0_STRVS